MQLSNIVILSIAYLEGSCGKEMKQQYSVEEEKECHFVHADYDMNSDELINKTCIGVSTWRTKILGNGCHFWLDMFPTVMRHSTGLKWSRCPNIIKQGDGLIVCCAN